MREAPAPAFIVRVLAVVVEIEYPAEPLNLRVPRVTLVSRSTLPPAPLKAASCSTPLGGKLPAQLPGVDHLLFAPAVKAGSKSVMNTSPEKASLRASARGAPPQSPGPPRLPESA